MAENTVVHIGENSPEQVAYKLMRDCLLKEKLPEDSPARIKRLLDIYAECLHTVRGYRDIE